MISTVDQDRRSSDAGARDSEDEEAGGSGSGGGERGLMKEDGASTGSAEILRLVSLLHDGHHPPQACLASFVWEGHATDTDGESREYIKNVNNYIV